MNITDIKTHMHLQEWAKLIEARQDSGLSVKAWCQQNNLPEYQYYYYLKKLRLLACERQDGTQFALVPDRARVLNPVDTRGSHIKITLSNAVVEISEGATEEQVRFALEVLLNAQ